MHAAQVQQWGQPPKFVSITDEAPPPPGYEQLHVLAVGLPNIARSRASGRHYTTSSKDPNAGLPYTAGVDGVGLLTTGTSAGKIAYFNALNVGKSYQTTLNVPSKDVFVLSDSADPVQVAGLMNPALASWMAIRRRLAVPLPENFTALIIGGSSFSGRVSVGILKYLGARKVIGVARSAKKMEGLGYDETVELAEDASKTDFGESLKGVDLVLDFLFAEPGLAVLTNLPPGKRTQYVHIGSSSGYKMNVNYDTLRNKDLIVTGSGLGSWGGKDVAQEAGELVKAVSSDHVGDVHWRVEKLEDVERVWPEGDKEGRVVFVTEHLDQFKSKK